jgi:hypothetical protein
LAELITTKPKPRKVRSDAVPDEILGKALIKCSGRVTYAADAVGIDWSTMHERIDKSPYLQKIKQDCIERRIDNYERGLDKLASEDSLGAICFGLKTIGKSRGYTEHTAFYVPNDMAASVGAMLRQMAEHQEAKKIENQEALKIEDNITSSS